MGILRKTSPWERTFREAWKQEQKFLRQYGSTDEGTWNRKLAELVPDSLLDTLHTAFEKAFALVFEKGSGYIQKAGRQAERRRIYQVQAYAAELREDRKSLRAFSKEANRAGWTNVALSGTAGMGMGLLGIALPDVPLFAAMLLKSVYETAESFGFPCEDPEERIYALRIIEAALSAGEELLRKNRALDAYAQTGCWAAEPEWNRQIADTARKVSQAVLYGKALQNIPVAGVLGGAGDAVCLRRVQRYAAIKYQKRFLIARWLKKH